MKRLPVIISVAAIAVFAVCVALWQYFSVPVFDDVDYQYFCLDTCEDDFWEMRGPLITSFSEAAESAWNHWKLVNGRLANILMPFAVLLPSWLLASLHGIVSGAVMLLVLFFGLGRKALSYSWICAALPLAGWKLLPWFNNFCADAYMMNYIWPSAFILGFMWVVLNPEALSSRLRTALASILGFVAGIMHEGYSLPALVVMAVVIFIPSFAPENYRRSPGMRRRVIVPLVFFMAGTLLCTFSLSTLSRLGRYEADNARVSFGQSLMYNLKFSLPLFVYILCCIIAYFKVGWHKLWPAVKEQRVWILFVACVWGLLLVLGLNAARMLMLPDLVLLIMSMQIFLVAFSGNIRPLKGAAVVCVALQIVFFANLLPYQIKASAILNEYSEIAKSRGDGKVYTDTSLSAGVPWWIFALVHDNISPETYFRHLVKMIPKYKERRNVCALVLPADMQHVTDFDSLPEIPGDNPFRGVYPMILSRRPIERGEEVEIVLGERLPLVNPLRYGQFVAGPCVAVVRNNLLVPAMEPDTIYAVFIEDKYGRVSHQEFVELNYPVTR